MLCRGPLTASFIIDDAPRPLRQTSAAIFAILGLEGRRELRMSTEPNLRINRLSEWDMPMRKKFLIAGPCSVESEEQMLETAVQLSAYEVTAIRGGIWKPRTRPGSFEGVGARGLRWLKQAGNAVGLPVATEAAKPAHVEECLKAGIDILWIADALRGVDIPVMIKNPMNPDLELWIGAIERINKAGITKIMAVHRGFSTY